MKYRVGKAIDIVCGVQTEEKRTLEEKRELSEAATAFLADKSCQTAILSLRQRYFGLLLQEQAASPRQIELCARLRALDDFPHELGTLVNDYRMAKKPHAA